MFKIICQVAVGLFFGLPVVFAQTQREKNTIIDATNVEELQILKQKFDSEYEARQVRINEFLQNNANVQRRFTVDGIEKEIYDVDSNGKISYCETTNLGSSVTIRANSLYTGGSLGLTIQGQGMTVGVWDSGPARETHVEFSNSRVNIFDFIDYSNHGTHVMGTVLAAGTNANARGIAYQASGKSFDWNNDYSEMSLEASLGLLVSNHSYWIGNNLSTWILGAYDSRAQQMDQITYAAPYYLPVVSAGNDRNSNSSSVISNHNQNKFGYDLIRGMNNAKNSLTVGAVSNVSNYISPSSVQMSSFSSWGPTDDGRIKPEVVAKGVSVFSSIATNNTSYDTYQGTSMASPAVAGSCLLLQQYYNSLNSNYMRSSTMKAVLMHTAREAGFNDGPDYEYGWGLVDVQEAANLITAKANGNSIIDELLLNNNTTYTRTFLVNNPSDIKVSICWTDPASPSFNSSTIDPDVSYLVNDLDLKLTKDNVDYFPWSLDKVFPFNQATNLTTNNVDIFERVDVDNAVGAYTLTVSHKGSIGTSGQRFSLIVSGSNLTLSSEDFKANSFSIYPNPANDILNIQSSIVLDGAKIEIFDMLGKNIYRNALLNNSIDISNFDSGIYLLNITTDEGTTYVKKFIKK